MGFLLLFAVLGSWHGQTVAATYHLAPGGNDVNPGSAELPWRSIAKANATLQAGDTVLLHTGTYQDPIRPHNSGTDHDNRIIYRAFGDGDVTLTGFAYGSNPAEGGISVGQRQYITVSGRAIDDPETVQRFKLIPRSGVNSAINFCGATGAIVENIYVHCATTSDSYCNRGVVFCEDWWEGYPFESKWNILRNSYIKGAARLPTPDNTEDLIVIAGNAHHNLIENNVLQDAYHVVLNNDHITATHNTIRNNTIINTEHTALSLYPGGIGYLIENNAITASYDNVDPIDQPGNAVQLSASETILRYNTITKGGTPIAALQEDSVGGFAELAGGNGNSAVFHNRVYNNTLADHGSFAYGRILFGGSGATGGDGRYINNILYNSTSVLLSNPLVLVYYREDDPLEIGDRWISNAFGQPDGTDADEIIVADLNAHTLQQAKTDLSRSTNPNFRDWNDFANFYTPTPGFNDHAGADYTLSASSPLIDAGAPLSEVSIADTGTGIVLKVEDARFFHTDTGYADWMNIHSDWIAVGPSLAMAELGQIQTLDTTNHTLSLKQSLNRNPGDFIWLWRDSDGTELIAGLAPDIGALEFAQDTVINRPPASSPLAAPTNLRILIDSTDPNIRTFQAD